MRDVDANPDSATRPVELIGTFENITKAERLIKDVIAEVLFCSVTRKNCFLPMKHQTRTHRLGYDTTPAS